MHQRKNPPKSRQEKLLSLAPESLHGQANRQRSRTVLRRPSKQLRQTKSFSRVLPPFNAFTFFNRWPNYSKSRLGNPQALALRSSLCGNPATKPPASICFMPCHKRIMVLNSAEERSLTSQASGRRH